MRISTFALLLLAMGLAGCANPGPNPEDVAKEMYSRETLLSRADRELQDNEPARALIIYQELLKRNGKDPLVLASAATVSYNLHLYDLAAGYYEQMLTLTPGDIALRLQLAEINIQRQHYDTAESQLKSITDFSPQSGQAWNARGLIADLRGNYGESERYYAEALKAEPANTDILNNRGYSLIMAHRYAEAETVLRQGLQNDSDNARIRNNLLITLAWQGRYEEAVSVGRVSLEEWIAYNNVGYIAQLKGDYNAAIRFYNAALSSSPRFYPTAAANREVVLSMKEMRK